MKKTTLSEIKLIEIPKIEDRRGNLSVIENNEVIPFDIKRVYYLYDVPSDAYRGGHAHKKLYQFLIPLSGSFEVILKDGYGQGKIITLNKPSRVLVYKVISNAIPIAAKFQWLK